MEGRRLHLSVYRKKCLWLGCLVGMGPGYFRSELRGRGLGGNGRRFALFLTCLWIGGGGGREGRSSRVGSGSRRGIRHVRSQAEMPKVCLKESSLAPQPLVRKYALCV